MCTKLIAVDRLGSGVRVSTSFQIFALTAGECPTWWGKLSARGNVPGGICPRGKCLTLDNVRKSRCFKWQRYIIVENIQIARASLIARSAFEDLVVLWYTRLGVHACHTQGSTRHRICCHYSSFDTTHSLIPRVIADVLLILHSFRNHAW